MSEKDGVPRTPVNNNEFLKFQQKVGQAFAAVINLGDALGEAQKRLVQSGRIQNGGPEHKEIMIELATIQIVANECLQVPLRLVEEVRKTREKASFEKSVNSIMEKIAPLIILP